MTTTRRTLFIALVAVAVAACGDAPLATLGNRSSHWINEPQVTTTVRPSVEVPRLTPSSGLRWFNDDIVTVSIEDTVDRDAVIAEVFGRREGDRFIQASRFEIVAVVPEIEFPLQVPYGAEWVSSQLVIETNGRLSGEPIAAFGIWSATPYTRSRSVAQMAVLTVANDPTTADEMAQPDAVLSCGRFAENETDECVLLKLGGRHVWKLTSAGGATLVWFSGSYRYELYGRSFVPSDVLETMSAGMLPLIELVNPSTED